MPNASCEVLLRRALRGPGRSPQTPPPSARSNARAQGCIEETRQARTAASRRSPSRVSDVLPQLPVVDVDVVHLLAVLARLAEDLVVGLAEELPVALLEAGFITSELLHMRNDKCR